jgi:hypothetical protein
MSLRGRCLEDQDLTEKECNLANNPMILLVNTNTPDDQANYVIVSLCHH